MQDSALKTIGYVAKRTGASVSALRFYADEGLVPTVRAASGHRLFHRSSIRRIAFILISQKLGYTLEQIGAALATLPNGRTPTQADWGKLAKRFSQDIDARIQALEQLRVKLDGCIGCGCLSLEYCQLYNPDDAEAVKGAGAHLFNPKHN